MRKLNNFKSVNDTRRISLDIPLVLIVLAPKYILPEDLLP